MHETLHNYAHFQEVRIIDRLCTRMHKNSPRCIIMQVLAGNFRGRPGERKEPPGTQEAPAGIGFEIGLGGSGFLSLSRSLLGYPLEPVEVLLLVEFIVIRVHTVSSFPYLAHSL